MPDGNKIPELSTVSDSEQRDIEIDAIEEALGEISQVVDNSEEETQTIDKEEEDRLDAVFDWAENPTDENLDRVLSTKAGDPIEMGGDGASEPSKIGGQARSNTYVDNHSIRPQIAEKQTPIFPNNIVQEATRSKLAAIADAIMSLKKEAERVVKAEDEIYVAIEKADGSNREGIRIPKSHELFFEIIVYFMFKDVNESQREFNLTYYKGSVELTTEKMSASHILDIFQLRSIFRDFIQKRAIHRVVKNNLEAIETDMSNVRKKASWKENEGKVPFDADKAAETVTGMAQVYNMEAYSYIESLIEAASSKVDHEWNNETSATVAVYA